MIAPAHRLANVKEYYFSKKLREVARLKAEGHPIINMGIGSPDLPPHPSVTEALNHSSAQPTSHGYQSYQGIPALREAIASFYQKHYAVSLSPTDEILPMMGSKEAIMHISLAYLNPGDKVLIPNPGYPTYSSVTELVGAKAVYYDLKEENQWLPDIGQLEELAQSGIKLMWINYPHMPTGANASREALEALVTFAKKHQILLVNDNPYSFILTQSPISILSIDGAKDIALELNSLSKTFNMPGWRVGMLCGQASYLQEVLKVKSNMDSGMFLGIQEGAIAALNLDQRWFDQMDAIYHKRREAVWKLAERVGAICERNSAGMFVWAKLATQTTPSALVDKLLYENHIFITPGDIFGSNGHGYIRFSLCVPENLIQEAFDRVNSTWTK
ncbi:pyridoxal phosphate-dependent aminotransferase [Echinicola vietnamensis]|uniref:Aminotransferase n=1 Tax=Echinicola vietnamensis (strain DSM 17526 / LMG 23754 / KMM 6221) TaxID=926556 RepID=L0FUI4_ECHVK|nr:aminotransferase class I/II-fold pyridoxal phosphate-dependent enzyme [Echinicola vietnamensis]AGA76421.1 aspartate/tyrosine/aromatic aminotransferase [Echinicola vietnamensis DSM 17526]